VVMDGGLEIMMMVSLMQTRWGLDVEGRLGEFSAEYCNLHERQRESADRIHAPIVFRFHLRSHKRCTTKNVQGIKQGARTYCGSTRHTNNYAPCTSLQNQIRKQSRDIEIGILPQQAHSKKSAPAQPPTNPITAILNRSTILAATIFVLTTTTLTALATALAGSAFASSP